MAATPYRVMAAGNYGGDSIERECWPLFLQRDWPSYETFWQRKVVAVTTRPQGMRFKSDADLAAIGRGAEDLCLAQLHYTILVHLRVAYAYRAVNSLEAENFTHAIIRLSSATDVADEILGRLAQPGTFDPWSEDAGRAARNAWRQAQGQMQDVRDYRNRLVHGRIFMAVRRSPTDPSYFPAIGREQSYIDWRTITLHFNQADFQRDYATGHDILEYAWRQVLNYLERSWQAVV